MTWTCGFFFWPIHPFMPESEAFTWAARSLDFAFDCGATAATLIPTRAGNGAMEALAAQGSFLAAFSGDAGGGGSVRHRPGACPSVCRFVGRGEIRVVRSLSRDAHRKAPADEPGAADSAGDRMRSLRRGELNRSCDIAVVGSGFSGSLLAMIARQLGRSVVLIERGSHPRVVIGESSTPLSNLLLEELAEQYNLDAVRTLAKWGSWQRAHPKVACGLKRGFTFYHHRLGSPDLPDPERRDQLLVAASPRDEIADTHWYRADFDQFLVREAQRLGVEYLDRVTLREARDTGSDIVLRGTRGDEDLTVHAGFVVDATGPHGFLHQTLQLDERVLPGFPATQALYSHFSGVRRFAESRVGGAEGSPPYPVDDAAVHHVFDGGWIWVLRFNNGITSAGVAATDRVASELRLADGEPAWERLLQQLPALQEQFSGARTEQPFRHLPKLGFRSAAIAGSRWALLPSAAGFVDPLLSTGFPLTLLGVARLAEIIAQDWKTAAFDAEATDVCTADRPGVIGYRSPRRGALCHDE